MTTKGLYNILDKYDLHDENFRLTVDGKPILGVTVTLEYGYDEDYFAAAVDIHTTGDEE